MRPFLKDVSLRSASFLRAHTRRISTRPRAHLAIGTAQTLPFQVTSFPLFRTVRRVPTFGLQKVHYFSEKVLESDKVRPDLFYHLSQLPPRMSTDSVPAYAISFLKTPPRSPSSKTIVGWVPAFSEHEDSGLDQFVENPRFRELLHKVIRDGLVKQVDEIQINGALQLQEGWMHIHDDRNIPPLGRIGDPDDIIATVLVQDSKINPETYQPMPSYRLCTEDGPVKLTPSLAHHLLAFLEKENNLE